MTGPHDPAAAGGDLLRPSHADRELVIEALRDAFVQGRLTKDELGARVGRALAAHTGADLAALTADISPVLAPAIPARHRPLARAAVASGGCLILALAAFLVGRHLDRPGLNTYYSWSQLCLAVAIFAVAVAPLTGTLAAATGVKGARGQLPPGLRPDGHALDGERRDGGRQ